MADISTPNLRDRRRGEDGVAVMGIAQSKLPDPVLAAAVFKPNACGGWELASFPAMSQRQLLKGAGSYFAERVLVAVTTMEVAAIDIGVLGMLCRRARCWRRDDLIVRAIDNRDGLVPLSALSIASRCGRPQIEVAPCDARPSTISVFERLVP